MHVKYPRHAALASIPPLYEMQSPDRALATEVNMSSEDLLPGIRETLGAGLLPHFPQLL